MQWKTVLAALAGIAVTATGIHAEYETLNLFGAIGGGFGMGGIRYESRKVENGNTSVTDQFFNYGSGFKFDIGCQYFMMENVALQPSFSYSVGTPFKVEDINALQTTDTTFSRHLFGIKLQVVPRFEVLDLISMYTGVGIGLYWNARPFKIVSESGTGGTSVTQEATGKITSKPALGFLAQLGTDYPLNDKLTLFGEIGVEQISFSLDKYTVKKPVSATTYYSKDDSNTDNLDPQKVPGSNFQIRLGVRYAIK